MDGVTITLVSIVALIAVAAFSILAIVFLAAFLGEPLSDNHVDFEESDALIESTRKTSK